MPRLTRIHSRQGFVEAAEGRVGRHVLLNAMFESGPPEAIRINLASPNCSYYRAGGEGASFGLNAVPFRVTSPGVLFSVGSLAEWSANFAFARDVMGDTPLANIPQNDPRNDAILQALQDKAYQFLYTDDLVQELPIYTTLYREYLRHPNRIPLHNGDEISAIGCDLLKKFRNAVSVYSQIPELREYCVQENVREGNLGPAGEQFREWFQQNHRILGPDEAVLDYLAYALRPLRLSGADFHWNQGQNDARMLAVDMLCRYGGRPVWVELKMKGDTWTSAALQQILLYGSMLAGEHQANRLRTFFPHEFQDESPWMAVLVEDRDDPEFLQDFNQSVQFANSPAAINLFRQSFQGVILGKIQKNEDGWNISAWNVIQ